MIHELKIEDNYLQNLLAGVKKAEVRINDRDYQRGDLLRFFDYSELEAEEHLFEITHIHSGFGLEQNYVLLSVKYVKESV